jgi:hypothetical protein
MTKSALLCLIALTKQPLKRDGSKWRFGRRTFSNGTVRALLDRGLARRLGDHVIGVGPLNDNIPAASA